MLTPQRQAITGATQVSPNAWHVDRRVEVRADNSFLRDPGVNANKKERPQNERTGPTEKIREKDGERREEGREQCQSHALE